MLKQTKHQVELTSDEVECLIGFIEMKADRSSASWKELSNIQKKLEELDYLD